MSVSIRPMADSDLDAVDRINRLAFGTFFGLPDPTKFRGDGDGVRTRFRAGTATGVVAEENGVVVGAGMGSVWGSFAVIGPVMVEPSRWGGGIAHVMTPALVQHIAARGPRLLGLFTHPQSASHIRLYEGVGFHPQTMHAYMAKPVAADRNGGEQVLYSTLDDAARKLALSKCREICSASYPGLDVGGEIEAVRTLKLGDTVLLRRESDIAGFAVCHSGKGSECGSGAILAKLAFVRPGTGANAELRALLECCEALGGQLGAQRFVACTNAARGSYGVLKDYGFRAFMNGIVMMQRNDPGFHRPDVFALDDWR